MDDVSGHTMTYIEESYSNVNDVGSDSYNICYTEVFLRNMVFMHLDKRIRYDTDVAETFVQFLRYYTCALHTTNGAPHFHFLRHMDRNDVSTLDPRRIFE